MTYGYGNFAVIRAGISKSDLNNGGAVCFVSQVLFAFEKRNLGLLGVDVGAENKAVFTLVKVLSHEATAVLLRLAVHAVSERRAEAAGLERRRLGAEFDGKVKRPASGIGETLEHILELVRSPAPLPIFSFQILATPDFLTVSSVEKGLGAQRAGEWSLKSGILFGTYLTKSFYK